MNNSDVTPKNYFKWRICLCVVFPKIDPVQLTPTLRDRYRISLISFQGNKFFVGPEMGKLFKEGNYLKEETTFSWFWKLNLRRLIKEDFYKYASSKSFLN